MKFLGILHFICEKTERRHTLETKSTTLKLKVGTRQPKWPPSILAKQSHTRPRLSVDRVPPPCHRSNARPFLSKTGLRSNEKKDAREKGEFWLVESTTTSFTIALLQAYSVWYLDNTLLPFFRVFYQKILLNLWAVACLIFNKSSKIKNIKTLKINNLSFILYKYFCVQKFVSFRTKKQRKRFGDGKFEKWP